MLCAHVISSKSKTIFLKNFSCLSPIIKYYWGYLLSLEFNSAIRIDVMYSKHNCNIVPFLVNAPVKF